MALLLTLNDLVKQKLIRRSNHSSLPLSIYNYTEIVQFKKRWDEVTLAARGIVLDTETGEVVARPFPKFFNLEEQIDQVSATCKPVKVYEKVDGSLGILFYYRDQWICASRGSFHSDQAVKMTELVQPLLNATPGLSTHFTYIFEIIYPENRIVVNYHQVSELVLLGVVNTKTGQDYFEFAHFIPGIENGTITAIRLVKELPHVDNLSADEILRLKAQDRNNEEGYVVRYDNGVRIKVKFANYLILHKSWTNFSTLAVLEWIQNDRSDRVINHLDQIPDEFHTEAKEAEEAILRAYGEIETTLTKKIQHCHHLSYKDVPEGPEKGIICQQLRLQRSNEIPSAKITLALSSYIDKMVKARFIEEGLLKGSKYSGVVAGQRKKEENERLRKSVLRDHSKPLLHEYIQEGGDVTEQKVPTIIVLIGISGAGKSCRARQIANERKSGSVVVISRDHIRQIFASFSSVGELQSSHYYAHNTHLQECEDLVTQMQHGMIRTALDNGKSIILDNTHLKFEYMENIIKSYASDAVIVFEILKCPLKECIARQQTRDMASRTPEVQITRQLNMLKRLEKFINDQNFQIKASYHKGPDIQCLDQCSSLPQAYVVDLDGTLCEHVSRTPFDFHLVHLDRVFPKVKDLVLNLHQIGKFIIICSGRPESCKSSSTAWLRENGIPFHEIHFRKHLDHRVDAIVKEEMWRDIATRYDIQMMIEDRDQVVAAARKNGYTVAQVAYGDF